MVQVTIRTIIFVLIAVTAFAGSTIWSQLDSTWTEVVGNQWWHSYNKHPDIMSFQIDEVFGPGEEVNTLEDVDTPGVWYYDNENKRIYTFSIEDPATFFDSVSAGQFKIGGKQQLRMDLR